MADSWFAYTRTYTNASIRNRKTNIVVLQEVVIYGDVEWPSWCYWIVPGTWREAV